MSSPPSPTRAPLQPQDSNAGVDPHQIKGATKIASIVRGRRGRRASVDEARERFGYLKKATGPPAPPARSRTNAPPPGASRAVAGSTAASRSRSRARAPSAPAPPPPPEPREATTATVIAAQLRTVLERVGVESVMPELARSTLSVSEEELARACSKIPERGTRWDLNQKIKVRDERLALLRLTLAKVADEARALGSLANEVEAKLLKELAQARAEAVRADRAALDGSGMRDRVERLEKERDEAVRRAAEAEVKLAAAEGSQAETDRVQHLLVRQTDEALTKADLAQAQLHAAAESKARLDGGNSADVVQQQQHIDRLERQLVQAQSELDRLRSDASAATQALHDSAAGLACEIAANRARLDDALRRADALGAEASSERARACKLEGSVEAAQKHGEALREDLAEARREAASAEVAIRVSRDSDIARSKDVEHITAACRERAERAERDVDELKESLFEARALLKKASADVEQGRFESDGAKAELKGSMLELQVLKDELHSHREAAAQNLRSEEVRAAGLSSAVLAEAQLCAELRRRCDVAEEAQVSAKALADERAAYLQQAEKRASEAKDGVEKLRLRESELTQQAFDLKAAADASRQEFAFAEHALLVEKELRVVAESKEAAERRERTAALAQLLALQQRGAAEKADRNAALALQRDERAASDAALAARARLGALALEEHQEMHASSLAELDTLRQQLASADLERGREATLELCRARGELERLRTRLEAQERDIVVHSNDANQKVEDLEEKLREADTLRRKLHNTVQELRGNVRVFARVRPFLPSDEVVEGEEKVFDSCISTPADGTSLTLRGNADESADKALFAGKRAREAVDFSFDRVFGPATGQEEVFREVGEFVQSALDGFQVCLFSYGQTGSGKTHTMQGSGRGAMRGIIPRAMEHVAAYMQEQRGRGWEYEMEVTFVEIYNESVRDLLVPDKPAADKAEPAQSLEVRRDPKTGRTYVEHATASSVDPSDGDAVDALMALAARHRCVAATDMNATSSRSHAVFTLHLRGTHAEKRARVRGALNLVDLAGSERLDRSGATGLRAKEAAHINKSLSALAGIFAALHSKKTHVPYRDSKLTFLLQPALSGDGKTLLFVNLSPTAESAPESLCSLRFAKQVNSVELGKATRSIETFDPEKENDAPTPKASQSAKKIQAQPRLAR